ncbi:MAG: hypothetical protein NZ693_02910, partial [Thermoflexales bacterium]|nr:hypothetical protein [Thermoflexales bacterium]
MKGYWGRAALAAWALVLAACGQSESPTPLPLQSPIELPTPPAPTAPAPPQPTAELPGTVVLPFEVTPDTRATSRSVIATITALAATPTFPPTATRRPRPRPVGAGEGEVRQPSPTPILGDEVALVSFSRRVYPGGAAAVAVRARPGVVCTIAAEYQGDNQGAARALETPGADRRAGRDGVVAWILPIP